MLQEEGPHLIDSHLGLIMSTQSSSDDEDEVPGEPATGSNHARAGVSGSGDANSEHRPSAVGADTDKEWAVETGCCSMERGGLRLSSWVLVSIFIYINLLNYVDRGLVNGMLPKYCVNCLTKMDKNSCATTASCEWRVNATASATVNATCAFNTSVVPRLGIGGSLNIKETAQGVIAGSFMGGYCVFSPIFAYLSTVYKPFTLMGLGLTAWCVACALASVAPSFGKPRRPCTGLLRSLGPPLSRLPVIQAPTCVSCLGMGAAR